MKKNLKTIILILFLISGAFAFSARSTITLPKTIDKTDDKKIVRDLFQRNCARCHGDDGKSETELGQLLNAPDLTDKSVRKMGKRKITRVILNGKEGMPAFNKKLDVVQIKELTDYVRSLR